MMLESLFAEARDDKADASATLMARIVADAEAALVARTPVADPTPRASWLGRMAAAVGGWPSVAGLATAGVMGLAIGLYQPVVVTSLGLGTTSATAVTTETTSYALDDLVPSFYDLATEG